MMTPNHNLPVQPTPFVGRTQELADIAALLADPACRLLTLVGPGGIGKTRLALEASRTLVEDVPISAFPDGIFFVPLQSLASPDFILSAIADAVGFQFQPESEPQKQLLDYLRPQTLLLMLDNFEHLLDGITLVADILASAPNIKILATSRETLNVREEWLYPLKGLRFPQDDREEQIADYDAVQLFVQNAQRARPDFSLSDEREAVFQVCKMVEGMPLALEMTAAWLKRLPCQEIVREIERGLDILESPARNIPPRHRSIRAVFDHSWNLLTISEQDVFKKVSVFRGGFRKEAAQSVAGASLKVLSALVDKSLLRVDASGRYYLHELVRQYAQEQFESSPEASARVQDLHCVYYAEFLHQREASLFGQNLQEALQEIEEEIDNVRAAWNRGIKRGKVSELGKAAKSLQLFYNLQSWLQEGEIAFGDAVAVFGMDEFETNQATSQVFILLAYGDFCADLGQYTRAREALEAGLNIARRLGSQGQIAAALASLGGLAYYRGEAGEAFTQLRESRAIAAEIGDSGTAARSSMMLGVTLQVLGEYREAKQFGQQAVALWSQIIKLGHHANRSLVPDGGMLKAPVTVDHPRLAFCLINLASCELKSGEYGDAEKRFQEVVAYAREANRPKVLTQALEIQGDLLHALGRYDEAERLLRESLAIAREFNFPRKIEFALIRLGDLLCTRGRYEEADPLFQEALALARQIGQAWQQALALRGLGNAAYGRTDYAQAKLRYHESLAVSKEIGWQAGILGNLGRLGRASLAIGEYHESTEFFCEALQSGIGSQETPVILDILVGAAELLAAQGEAARSVEPLRFSVQHPACRADTRQHAERLLAKVEAELAPDHSEAALQRGKAHDLEAVVKRLLRLLVDLGQPNQEAASPNFSMTTQGFPDSLNERELRILSLIAQGMSNREIAEKLVLALSTIKWYINEIYSKLHVADRTEAIVRAREQHLIS